MTDQQPDNNEAAKSPALPDGIGLSHEEVRQILQGNHGKIENDDPILMLITLLNAFLTEEEKLLDRHNKALSRIISDRTDGYIKAVEGTTASFGKSLSSSSMEGITKVFKAHGQKMEQFRSNMTWLTAIAGTSALINVAVFAATALWRKM
jgi:hypothetical protein